MYVVAVCCRGVCGRAVWYTVLYRALSEMNLTYTVQKLPGRYLTKPDRYLGQNGSRERSFEKILKSIPDLTKNNKCCGVAYSQNLGPSCLLPHCNEHFGIRNWYRFRGWAFERKRIFWTHLFWTLPSLISLADCNEFCTKGWRLEVQIIPQRGGSIFKNVTFAQICSHYIIENCV